MLVGRHVGLDCAILRAAAARFGPQLSSPSLDTMHVALAVSDSGNFALEPDAGFTLDGLCQRFGVAAHDRHTAVGDAFLTAQVFVRLLRLCARGGLDVMAICEKD